MKIIKIDFNFFSSVMPSQSLLLTPNLTTIFLRILQCCMIATTLLLPCTVYAGAFQIFEQSASSVASGGANQAEAKDASAIYWNPAALTQLPGTQFSGVFQLIKPLGKLSDVSGQTTVGPLKIGGSDGGAPGVLSPSAALYYSKAVSPNTTLGLSVTTPFGLALNYEDGWIGRYQVTEAALLAVDFGMSAGYKVSSAVSIGLGLDLQYAKTKLGSATDLSTACLGTAAVVVGLAAQCAANGFTTPGNVAVDGRAVLNEDSWGLGWNTGILWHPTPDLRMGLAYRSKVSHDFEGNAKFTKPAALPTAVSALPALSDSAAQTKLVFPETISASFFYQPTQQWSVMGASTWAKWSRSHEIRTTFKNGAADAVIPLDWRNTWRISGAIGYQISHAMTLRAGAVFDQSPTTSARSPTLQIPDKDRHAFSLGGTYIMNESTSIDFGAIRYQLKKVPIVQSSPQAGSFTGNFPNAAVIILSIQANYSFK